MEQSVDLIFLSFSLFAASFVAGLIPLSIPMTLRSLHAFNIFACGLLLGTCLAVVIPEGVHTLEAEDGGEIGFSLVSGFLFMFLMDYLSHQTGGGHSHSHGGNISYHSVEINEQQMDDDASNKSAKRASVTLGLLIHAATDGIALGATKASAVMGAAHENDESADSILSIGQSEFLIFFALFCHKVPAAVGLTSFLKSTGLSDEKTKQNLFFFSIAAPVMVIVTFISLTWTTDATGIQNTQFPGVCLLFSGGTFLYVSTVHVLGDLEIGGLSFNEALLLSAGSLAPLLLMQFHEH
eukprot:maker-scaffold_5-snap-gene-19.5-mRNA-1 protein AED:0.00 eAED:0.00 QI:85/1/1/1/0/0/2/137/294